MPASDDKTLSQTIRSVMTEPARASQAAPMQAAEGISKGTTGETQSGGTPEYVSGVDISSYPEQERPIVRRALEEKGKLLEKGYQPKFAEIAKLRQAREEMLNLGVTEDDAVRIIKDHVSSKTNAKDAKKEVSRLIDKLKEDALGLSDPREIKSSIDGLNNLENIIKELTNTDEIKKEIADLKLYVNHSRGRDFQSREQSLTSAMDALVPEYGRDFIDKYRETVVKEGLKYTDADPEQILGAIANPKELKQAILSNSVKKEDVRKQEKINAIAPQGSGMTSPLQTLDIKQTPMKGILSQVFARK